jgi:hypothetical protein
MLIYLVCSKKKNSEFYLQLANPAWCFGFLSTKYESTRQFDQYFFLADKRVFILSSTGFNLQEGHSLVPKEYFEDRNQAKSW